MNKQINRNLLRFQPAVRFAALLWLFLIATSVTAQISFNAPQQNPFGISPPLQNSRPALADIDGDGDADLFMGVSNGNYKYQENIGTATTPVLSLIHI